MAQMFADRTVVLCVLRNEANFGSDQMSAHHPLCGSASPTGRMALREMFLRNKANLSSGVLAARYSGIRFCETNPILDRSVFASALCGSASLREMRFLRNEPNLSTIEGALVGELRRYAVRCNAVPNAYLIRDKTRRMSIRLLELSKGFE